MGERKGRKRLRGLPVVSKALGTFLCPITYLSSIPSQLLPLFTTLFSYRPQFDFDLSFFSPPIICNERFGGREWLLNPPWRYLIPSLRIIESFGRKWVGAMLHFSSYIFKVKKHIPSNYIPCRGEVTNGGERKR